MAYIRLWKWVQLYLFNIAFLLHKFNLW